MDDVQLHDILEGTLEAVKTQMVYVRNLHDAFSSLYDAMLRVDDRVAQFDKEEILKIRPNPVQQSQLDAIEALLQKLGKARRDSDSPEPPPNRSQ
jgi:hypothetical protein